MTAADRLAGLARTLSGAVARGRAGRWISGVEARSVAAFAPAAVIGVDSAGRVTFWNPAAERMFGHRAEQALGRSLVGLIFSPGEQLAGPGGLAAEGAGAVEAVAVAADGREMPVALTVARPPAAGATRAIVYVRDISEQRRVERGQRLLARTAELLSSSSDYERTLRAVAALAVPDLADWCGVDVPGPRGLPTPVAIAHARPDRVALARELRHRYPVDESDALTHVMSTGESFLQTEVSDEAMVAYAQDEEHLRLLRAVGFRSLLVVPLKAGRRTIGAMTFVRAESGHRFDARDVALAEELAARAGTAVDNARLVAERAELTQTLLATLRPPKLPVLPGWEIATLYEAAERTSEVGGDFYDLFSVRDGWMLVMGDVIGKGPAAAALTSLARWSIRSAATATVSPSGALAQINTDLDREEQPGLLSAVCVLLRERDRAVTATIAVAGHPLPILVRGDDARPVGRHAVLLGVAPETIYPETTVELHDNDALLLYTDGLLDAAGPGGRFGEERLLDAARMPAASAAELLEHIAERLAAFLASSPDDDIAMLAARRNSTGRPIDSTHVPLDRRRAE